MRTRGFTLVELLVVVTIIGILIALLLPAVQAAREAARRGQCTNQLKQLGLALHNYHNTHQVMPPGLYNLINNWSTLAASERIGWFASILPFVEQEALYDLWVSEFKKGVNGLNFSGRNTVVSSFLCPSDPAGAKSSTNGISGNYVLCGGGRAWGNQATATDSTGGEPTGLFYPQSHVRMADITDGTSGTLMTGEIILVLDNAPVVAGCSGGTRDMRGLYWNHVHMGSLFVSLRPPNAMTPDVVGWSCINHRRAPCNSCSYSNDVVTARSYHPGGASVGLADGSVRFASDTIDPTAFQALGTRNGGEVSPSL